MKVSMTVPVTIKHERWHSLAYVQVMRQVAHISYLFGRVGPAGTTPQGRHCN